MENLKIIDLIKEIKENDDMQKVSIDALCDYSETNYLCDIINEISDNYIDIYYYNLFEWAKDNFTTIQEANEEFGTDSDITKQIQGGQFYQNQQDIYRNLKEMILLYIYDNLKQNDILEITNEQNDILEQYAEECEQNDILPSYNDIMEQLEEGEQ